MGRSWAERMGRYKRTALLGSELNLPKILSPSDRMTTSLTVGLWSACQPYSREKKRKRRKTQKKQKGRSREACTRHRLSHIWHTALCTHSLVTSLRQTSNQTFISPRRIRKRPRVAIRAALLHAKNLTRWTLTNDRNPYYHPWHRQIWP